MLLKSAMKTGGMKEGLKKMFEYSIPSLTFCFTRLISLKASLEGMKDLIAELKETKKKYLSSLDFNITPEASKAKLKKMDGVLEDHTKKLELTLSKQDAFYEKILKLSEKYSKKPFNAETESTSSIYHFSPENMDAKRPIYDAASYGLEAFGGAKIKTAAELFADAGLEPTIISSHQSLPAGY